MIASLVARRSRDRPAGAAGSPEAAQVGMSGARAGAGASGCGAGGELNEFVRIVRTPFDGMLASAAPSQQGASGGAPDAESVSLTSGSLLEDGAHDSPPGALLLEAGVGGCAGAPSAPSSLTLALRVEPPAVSAEDAKTDLVLHPSGDLAESSSQAAAMARPEPASATTGYDTDEEQHMSAKPSASAKKAGAPRSSSAHSHSRSSERSASPASSHATDEDGDTTASEARSHSGNEDNEAGELAPANPMGTMTASPTSPTNNGLDEPDEEEGRKRTTHEKALSMEPENDLGSDFIDELNSSAIQPAPLAVKKHLSECVELLQFHAFTHIQLTTYICMRLHMYPYSI